MPPLEMLASVGEPIMPLAQPPATPVTRVVSAEHVRRTVEIRHVRTVVAAEICAPPSYVIHRGYRRW
jgi:hypothetical protein